LRCENPYLPKTENWVRSLGYGNLLQPEVSELEHGTS
jgi:hypothetical protein